MAEVVVVGDACLDVDIFPETRGVQSVVGSFLVAPAGSAGNVAITLTALGINSLLLYPSGDDNVDDILTGMLSAIGQKFCKVRGEGCSCLVVNVISRRGARRVYTSIGPRISRFSCQVPRDARFLHISGYLLELASPEVIKGIVDGVGEETTISLDLFPRVGLASRDVLEYLLRRVDILFGNESEFAALNLSSEAAVKSLLNTGLEAVVVKKGSRGAVSYSSEGVFSYRERVTVKSLKGAGDVFVASYLSGLRAGLSHNESLKIAVRNSAEHVAGGGPLNTVVRNVRLRGGRPQL
jgi:sugar/nucleoside kinase (ribokinase family)